MPLRKGVGLSGKVLHLSAAPTATKLVIVGNTQRSLVSTPPLRFPTFHFRASTLGVNGTS